MGAALLTAGVLTAGVLTGCASSGDGVGEPVEVVEVEHALVGEAPAGADAAVYFDLRSDTAEALIGATTEVAEATSLHTMEAVSGGGVMQPIERIELPAGEVTRLVPLGTHLMLEGLREDLVDGSSIAVTLDFADHTDVEVVVEVVPLVELAELLPTDAPDR